MSTQVDSLSTFIHSHHDGISTLLQSRSHTKIYFTDHESIAIVNWLSPLNFFVAHNDILRRRQIGTGEWLFETPEFEAWVAGTDRILWCSGQRKYTLSFEKTNKLN